MESYELITGGAGFIGSNLADALLRDGRRVVVADTLVRPGSERNAEWLERRHGDRVSIEQVDVRDAERIGPLARDARAVYHLAGQVAVTTSVAEPRDDFEVNLVGTFNVLEGARSADTPPPVLYASTNKVYGALERLEVVRTDLGYRFLGVEGVDEDTPLDFHSPYGCSKGAADQYVRDYARIYGVPTVVFRMSCIYGERQNGTEDQGWLAHLANRVLHGSPVTIYGDGYQTRDVLWVGDLVRAMASAVERADELAGAVFNIGGGSENVLSVRGALDSIMGLVGHEVDVESSEWRPGDQRVYVSELRRAASRLGWRPTVSAPEGLARLVAWMSGREEDGRARASTAPTLPSHSRPSRRRTGSRRATAAGGSE